MTAFWQQFEPYQPPADGLVHDRYVARMPDGSGLALPLRDLGEMAVAGLISNQASFEVVERIADWLAQAAATLGVEVVAGLPTLGHIFAYLVARRLGHANWVALGTTRKLWYNRGAFGAADLRHLAHGGKAVVAGSSCGAAAARAPRAAGRRCDQHWQFSAGGSRGAARGGYPSGGGGHGDGSGGSLARRMACFCSAGGGFCHTAVCPVGRRLGGGGRIGRDGLLPIALRVRAGLPSGGTVRHRAIPMLTRSPVDLCLQ